jgi:hypothetical protein
VRGCWRPRAGWCCSPPPPVLPYLVSARRGPAPLAALDAACNLVGALARLLCAGTDCCWGSPALHHGGWARRQRGGFLLWLLPRLCHRHLSSPAVTVIS